MSDSIKVAIKVRPLIKREKNENLPIQWQVQENSIVAVDTEMRKRGDGGFYFDHIFDAGINNSNVFDIIVKPIVDAGVNGFNGTVFAYGQTSSGKTYTMMGTSDEPGIIPLAIEHMFDAIANTTGREFLLRVSYLEIYNERVNDLLNKDNIDLKIHEDNTGQVIVKCKEEITNCPENVLAIMKKGDKNRRIGETNMNERSSRSHTIFRITIESREADGNSDGAIQVSQLNLVDLAGSERARQTGATGERFKEGRHINLSLSTLGLVIMQLSESQDGQKHVNFRDSKLTRLLQASLGGNAMTAIICAVTPAAFEETQCTLSFASRAKSVKNKPQLNEVMSDATLLKRYAKQLSKLNEELERIKQENRSAEVEEMESKLQEKDRMNQLLEERIELLKTRIVSSNVPHHVESFKCKSRRRRTWGGSGTFKQSSSTFQPGAILPTIKEMSPEKRHRKSIIQSVDFMDQTFQTAFADFELELIESERDREITEEGSESDEEMFITKNRQGRRVKFTDDVLLVKPINYDTSDSSPERKNVSIQVTSIDSSPGTPKHKLRESMSDLTRDYMELSAFTTLEKQLQFEEYYHCTHKEELQKFVKMQKEIISLTCEKEQFKNELSELHAKLETVESLRILEDEKTQMILDLKKRIATLITNNENFERVNNELNIQLKEKEEENILEVNRKQSQSERILELEKTVTVLNSEKTDLENVVLELRKNLKTTEEDMLRKDTETKMELTEQIKILTAESVAHSATISDLNVKLHNGELQKISLQNDMKEQLQRIKELEEQVIVLSSEKNKFERMALEFSVKVNEIELKCASDTEAKQKELQKISELENEIVNLTTRKEELEFLLCDPNTKLKEAEQVMMTEAATQTDKLEELLESEKHVALLTSKRDDFEGTSLELHTELNEETCEVETKDNRDYSSENNNLKNYIQDLHGFLNTVQEENQNLRYQLSTEKNLSQEDLNESNQNVSRHGLEEDNARLNTDLELKIQELEEIKSDVCSLKLDIEQLQKTIYLLTTENMETSNKLSAEKERIKEVECNLQKTIDELYDRIAKVTDEKINLESDLVVATEQLESLRSRTPEVGDNDKQILVEYQERIDKLTQENIELAVNVAEMNKELERIKESKSLLYDHECTYREKVTILAEKTESLVKENTELSTNLMDTIEENDTLKKECDALKNKLEMSLKSDENHAVSNEQQLMAENILLQGDIFELKAKISALTEENSKFSENLLETMEDLDNTRNDKLYDNTLHLSTIFDNVTLHDVNDQTQYEENQELLTTKVLSLQKEIHHLQRLNKKLSDLKLSPCTQCAHLKELSESRRAIKIEAKTLNHKLEDLQRKFDRKCADTEALKIKANKELNDLCDTSLNGSLLEGMNVSLVEERVQHLNNELQILKNDHHKLSVLYKEKCNELEKLNDGYVLEDTASTEVDIKSEKHLHKNETRIERIQNSIDKVKSDIEELKKHNMDFNSILGRFKTEKSYLVDQITALKSNNIYLSQILLESELRFATCNEKVQILENEIADLSKENVDLRMKQKALEKEKLSIEVEIEGLIAEKESKEARISGLQEISNQQDEDRNAMKSQLDLLIKEKDDLNNILEAVRQEYQDEITLMRKQHEELISSMEVKYKDEINHTMQTLQEYIADSEVKSKDANEMLNKYISENNHLKEEVAKMHCIKDKLNEMNNANEEKIQEDRLLIVMNKKLNDEISTAKECIIKEMKGLKRKINNAELSDKSVNEIFLTFLQAIMSKEEEIVKAMQEQFRKDKQKIEEEKKQLADAEKRATLWAKELEAEIEKLQMDLTKREEKHNGLLEKISQLEHLLREHDHEKVMLKEKMHSLENDFNTLQTEFDKKHKADVQHDEAIYNAHQREKQAQEAIKTKEAELQIRMKSEKEMYNKKVEELSLTIERHKTKNLELTNTLEGLEANEKQLRNIMEVKALELAKVNQYNQRMTSEIEQLTEACNTLNRQVEEKQLRIDELTSVLKSKCDLLSEYKADLENIKPEYEHLKEQANERKVSIERYKEEIQTLKMERDKEVATMQEKLLSEEVKNTGWTKQLTEINNKNITLVAELGSLKERCEELQEENAKLTRRIRHSTSKIKVEAEMEELKDLNKTLQNNLEGASNRIAELQDSKNQLLKELIGLKSQNEQLSQEIGELKQRLLLHKTKVNNTNFSKDSDKFDVLLQEKNSIALELEGKKLLLDQKDREMKKYIAEVKELTNKNKELDEELEELAVVIRERDIENAKLEEMLYCSERPERDIHNETEGKLESLLENKNLRQQIKEYKNKAVLEAKQIEALKAQNEELQKKMEAYYVLKKEHTELNLRVSELEGKLESRGSSAASTVGSALFEVNRRRQNRNETFDQKRQLDSVCCNTDSCKCQEKCEMLRKEIWELELQLVSKNGKIATLEWQIQSENFPYQRKCKDLEEHLLAFRNKNAELTSEIRRLQRAMNDISARECDICRRWRVNRRDQTTQTIPHGSVRFCSVNSGVVNDHVKIVKLEKEKAFMKDICRSRSRRIKELEERIKELETVQSPSVLQSIDSLQENSRQPYTQPVTHSNRQFDFEKNFKETMKENVPVDLLDDTRSSSQRRQVWNNYQ
ncbi:hypothetical protein KM043_009552 [Ampulex compressa]|nr:hypothetical protein KM043_009552 [Ampulex compressa]